MDVPIACVGPDADGVLGTGGGIVADNWVDAEWIETKRELSSTEDGDGGVPLERSGPIVAAG
jgi:hypothetical protein